MFVCLSLLTQGWGSGEVKFEIKCCEDMTTLPARSIPEHTAETREKTLSDMNNRIINACHHEHTAGNIKSASSLACKDACTPCQSRSLTNLDSCLVQKLASFVLSRRIPNFSGASSNQHDGLVTCFLQMPQYHDLKQASNMKASE